MCLPEDTNHPPWWPGGSTFSWTNHLLYDFISPQHFGFLSNIAPVQCSVWVFSYGHLCSLWRSHQSVSVGLRSGMGLCSSLTLFFFSCAWDHRPVARPNWSQALTVRQMDAHLTDGPHFMLHSVIERCPDHHASTTVLHSLWWYLKVVLCTPPDVFTLVSSVWRILF